MRITIAERLRPYSHLPGTFCMLPGASYQVQIFPSFIRLFDLSKASPSLIIELPLEIKGPVKEFTVLCDLEQGYIHVWGHTKTGFMRYRLLSQEKGRGVQLFIEKAPSEGFALFYKNCWMNLQAKESLLIDAEGSFMPYQVPIIDRLSLGNHKAQDWDLVKRRLDLTEIFPTWYRLGQMVPFIPLQAKANGTGTLLRDCQEAMDQGKPEFILQPFLSLFQAGFHGILVPRLVDDQYQGLVAQEELSSSLSPLVLLREGTRLIRQLFMQQQHNEIFILPLLPPEFHCGRLLQIPIEGAVLDLEWSKKVIRRMIVFSYQNQDMIFHFKKHLRSFRLRHEKQDHGQKISCGSCIHLEKNCYYFFDNFE